MVVTLSSDIKCVLYIWIDENVLSLYSVRWTLFITG